MLARLPAANAPGLFAVAIVFTASIAVAFVSPTVAILMWLVNGLFDNQVADKYLFVVPGLLLAMAAIASAMVPAQERRTTVEAGGAGVL